MNCLFCDQAALVNVNPPLCDRHLDLAILAERLNEGGQVITQTALRELITEYQSLTVQAFEVEHLMTEAFAAWCGVE